MKKKFRKNAEMDTHVLQIWITGQKRLEKTLKLTI